MLVDFVEDIAVFPPSALHDIEVRHAHSVQNGSGMVTKVMKAVRFTQHAQGERTEEV